MWGGEGGCEVGRGRCIMREWLCDGSDVCTEGWDKTNCSMCIPYMSSSQTSREGGGMWGGEGGCEVGRGRCIMREWLCDGSDVCTEGWDKTNCSMYIPYMSSSQTSRGGMWGGEGEMYNAGVAV